MRLTTFGWRELSVDQDSSMSVKAMWRSDGTPCDDAAGYSVTSPTRSVARELVIARRQDEFFGRHEKLESAIRYTEVNRELFADLRDCANAYILM
jgi:hypothetical protein